MASCACARCESGRISCEYSDTSLRRTNGLETSLRPPRRRIRAAHAPLERAQLYIAAAKRANAALQVSAGLAMRQPRRVDGVVRALLFRQRVLPFLKHAP